MLVAAIGRPHPDDKTLVITKSDYARKKQAEWAQAQAIRDAMGDDE
jgi:hypothetical protein